MRPTPSAAAAAAPARGGARWRRDRRARGETRGASGRAAGRCGRARRRAPARRHTRSRVSQPVGSGERGARERQFGERLVQGPQEQLGVGKRGGLGVEQLRFDRLVCALGRLALERIGEQRRHPTLRVANGGEEALQPHMVAERDEGAHDRGRSEVHRVAAAEVVLDGLRLHAELRGDMGTQRVELAGHAPAPRARGGRRPTVAGRRVGLQVERHAATWSPARMRSTPSMPSSSSRGPASILAGRRLLSSTAARSSLRRCSGRIRMLSVAALRSDFMGPMLPGLVVPQPRHARGARTQSRGTMNPVKGHSEPPDVTTLAGRFDYLRLLLSQQQQKMLGAAEFAALIETNEETIKSWHKRDTVSKPGEGRLVARLEKLGVRGMTIDWLRSGKGRLPVFVPSSGGGEGATALAPIRSPEEQAALWKGSRVLARRIAQTVQLTLARTELGYTAASQRIIADSLEAFARELDTQCGEKVCADIWEVIAELRKQASRGAP